MSQLPPISTFRSALSQLCAAFPYFCLTMSFGSSTAFQTILIAELSKNNSEIVATVDHLSSFASLDVLKIIGVVVGGTLTQYFGTRATALLSSLLFSSSWLLYYYSTSISTVILARILSTTTVTSFLTYSYVSEISEPHLRGTFLVIAEMTIVVGTFITLLLGTFMYWRTIALISLSVPIINGITVFLVPNSPIWLAGQERFNEAENALCSVRGWSQPNQVENEFQALVENTQKSVSNAESQKIGWRERSMQKFKLFHRRSFYAPLATMCLIFLVYIFGGGPIVETYSTIIFRGMKSPIEESVATAIVGAASIISKFIVIISVRRFGKRKLVLFFSAVVFFCQTLMATIGILKLTDGYYAWITSIAFIIANSAWKSGIGAISFMLVSEVLPSHVRYIGSAVCFSFYSIVVSILKKWFLYVVATVTLPVVFVMFAVVNAIEVVTYYLVMPETEGKTLQEIEDHFKRDKINNECSNGSPM